MQVQQMFEVRGVEFQRFQVVFVLLEFQVATIVVTWVWSERNPRVFPSLFAVAVEPSSISHSSSFAWAFSFTSDFPPNAEPTK